MIFTFSIDTQKLKEAMFAKGVTNVYLAEKLGVHKITVSSWRRGIRQPEPEMLKRIADVLIVDPMELVVRVEEDKDPRTSKEMARVAELIFRLKAKRIACHDAAETYKERGEQERASESVREAAAISSCLGDIREVYGLDFKKAREFYNWAKDQARKAAKGGASE